jgi:DNA invertase Pin-like site-specific DNA recombinase
MAAASFAIQKTFNNPWDRYVRDVPEDRLRFNFEMTFSDFARSKIVERTTRGKIKKLQEGYVIGCTRAPRSVSDNQKSGRDGR